MNALNSRQIIEQAKFTYSTWGKALEKQTKKEVDALKLLNLSNKTDKLKNRGYIFKNEIYLKEN